ncbi:MAG: carbon-nitrogen hydrolase family protein [Candidatus Nanopelagicales bacterium]
MKLAIYQCESMPGAVAENLDRLSRTADEASAAGADLLVTPEMFLSGYNIGAESARAHAEPRDAASAKAVAEMARANGIGICYGYPELAAGGEVFNSVQLIGPDGTSLAGYRKTHLFGELDRSMFSPSDIGSPVVQLGGWNIGLLICYDVEFPENCRRLALAGADLVLVPTANMVPYDIISQTIVPARSYENQFYLAYANYCGSEGPIQYCGDSVIAAPDGNAVARAGRTAKLVLGEIDAEQVRVAREGNNYLAERRPELYD